MKHKLALDVTKYEPANETVRYDTGLLKLLAEQDYLLARILVPTSQYMSIGLFHYQQAVEKFLKAYLKFKYDPSKFMRKGLGHNLPALLKLCEQYDAFFADESLHRSCEAINPFVDVGRYPNYAMQSYSLSIPSVFSFLDEFVFRMREFFQPRQEGENVADDIEMLYMGRQAHLNGFPASFGVTQDALMQGFELNNDYVERIKRQFRQLQI